MANQFLALALFLMMLSFFIIMNGVSSYDTTKQSVVLNSVTMAFSNKTAAIGGMAPVVEPSPLQAIHSGDSLAALEGLFGGHISHFKATKNKMGTTMHVRLPYGEFDRALARAAAANTPAGAPADADGFLPTMISLLRSEKSGVPYKVDIVLNVSPDPLTAQGQEGGAFDENVGRVAALSARLEEAGLPPQLMSAGLARGEEGQVDLYFTRYRAYDPLSAAGAP
jgi:hypothetical protein